MITLHSVCKPLLEATADGLAVFVSTDDMRNPLIQQLADTFFPNIAALFEEKRFTGATGSSVVVPVIHQDRVRHLVLVGSGSSNDQGALDIEHLRRAAGTLVRLVEKHKLATVAVQMPDADRYNLDTTALAQNLATIIQMAGYHFDHFITQGDRISEQTFDICLIADDEAAAQEGIRVGEIIGNAVNRTRTWVDMPPSKLTPAELAQHACIIAKECDLNISVFNEQQIKDMGMGGLAGVSAGSHQDCQFVVLEYNGGKKDGPTLGFVGKGITFDSGGLSIKPGSSMETMKEDMSGAAAVISTMGALAQLKAPVNVVGCVALSENLPSGTATKPGDILTFYNGKTGEVLNTDAEGRLVLADALSYAVKHYKLDALIDLATLTGACAYALGPYFSGLMSVHDDFAQKVVDAGERSGDTMWRLPLTADYKVAIKSKVADIKNIGSRNYMAGAITAGLFLQNFVGDVPWVHCDIAGTAFNVPDKSYFEGGATGVGVRLLVDLARNWQ